MNPRGMNILIVDDNETNRKLLRVNLEAEGYDTLEAGDGVEALALLAREHVDVVFSDILMPNMDGFRLCHEIRASEKLRDLPFIVYTSTYNSPSDVKLAHTIGADKYLTKPATTDEIVRALNEVAALSKPRRAVSPARTDENVVLKQHSQVLINKLEEKNMALQQAHDGQQRTRDRIVELKVGLEKRVAHRTRDLASKNEQLELEIAERRRAESERAPAHVQRIAASRTAEMAEISTNVALQVGNVLNRVHVSVSLLVDRVQQSKLPNLAHIATLLHEHERDLGAYITSDPQGKLTPALLTQLCAEMRTEQEEIVKELRSLQESVQRVQEAVAMQESVAKVAGANARQADLNQRPAPKASEPARSLVTPSRAEAKS